MKDVLGKIRKPGRAKGFAAWVLFGAISLVFVFMGITPGGGGITKGGPAAIVNSQPISIAEFRQTHERIQQQMGFDINQFPAQQRSQIEMNTRRRALETLISREVVAQAAEDKGITVPQKQLIEYIRNVPAFQEDGRFRRELYMNYLTYIRKTPAEFEKQLQRDIIVSEMQTLFTNALSPVKGEALYQAQLEGTKLNLGVINFTQEELEESIPVPASKIREFLAGEANVKVAEKYYQTNLADYQTPEQVKARHILVMADPKDKEATQEAKKKIAKAQERLKKESFAKVAEDMSDDTQSAKKGGDLGFFPRGRMVPEFEQTAFTLEKGKVSEPVQTQYGIHLIKVEDKKEAVTTPFEKEKSNIAKTLLAKEQVDQTLAEMNESLKNGDSKSLEKLLKSLKFQWEETGEFSMSDSLVPLIGSDEKVVAEAFELTKEGQMPTRVVTSNGEYYLLKLKSLKLTDDKDIKEEALDEQKLASSRRSGDVFNAWLAEQRKGASIKRNEQLLIVR